MPRVKGGVVTRRRRKRVLKLAKGYFGSKHILYKTAHEQVMRSLAYSYRDRKQRKRNFRKLWIARINAACKLNDFKYSLFINGLAAANIQINRKMLADLAVNDAQAFTNLVNLAKAALENKVQEEKVVYVNVNEYVNNFKKNVK
jgi:large subunit ribosomal protein L20